MRKPLATWLHAHGTIFLARGPGRASRQKNSESNEGGREHNHEHAHHRLLQYVSPSARTASIFTERAQSESVCAVCAGGREMALASRRSSPLCFLFSSNRRKCQLLATHAVAEREKVCPQPLAQRQCLTLDWQLKDRRAAAGSLGPRRIEEVQNQTRAETCTPLPAWLSRSSG